MGLILGLISTDIIPVFITFGPAIVSVQLPGVLPVIDLFSKFWARRGGMAARRIGAGLGVAKV